MLRLAGADLMPEISAEATRAPLTMEVAERFDRVAARLRQGRAGIDKVMSASRPKGRDGMPGIRRMKSRGDAPG